MLKASPSMKPMKIERPRPFSTQGSFSLQLESDGAGGG